MIGSSPNLNAVRRAVGQVAPTDATVLILGETGTGKELVARALHELSPRRHRAFVPVSCVALAPGLIASELVEACRRLVAVHTALSDRRFSIAQTLLRPLPGAAEWAAFVHQAGTFTPEQMLRELSLGEDALEHAEHLRSQPALADFTAMISAAETGNAMLLTPNGRNVADECWLGGVDSNGESVASSFGTSESEATTLADLTADLSGIARGFLGAYLGHRLDAGRSD